jgi:predicted ATP-grasp superfamily ATP-dependent carboligase
MGSGRQGSGEVARDTQPGELGKRLQDLPSSMPAAVVLGDLSLVRPLAGVRVVVATGDSSNGARYSRHVHTVWPLPAHNAGSHDAELAELTALGRPLCDRLGERAPLFYGSDWQLELLYRNREALSRYFRFQINDDQLAWTLHEKAKFYALCERLGIRVPRMLLQGGEHEAAAERILTSWQEPVLVKPGRKPYDAALKRLGFGKCIKAKAFASGREVLDHPGLLALRDQLIVQELIPSRAQDLYSFHGFCADDGRLLAWFCGHKLRTFPDFGGESALIELVNDAELERHGRDLVEKLQLKGPFKIDLVRDPRDGRFVALEVNARFSLWCDLGAAHGANLLGVAYDYLVEGRTPARPHKVSPRFRWLDAYRDYLGLRQKRPGLLGLFRHLGPILSSPCIYDTFAWDDPLPCLRWWQSFLKRRRHP